jgi:DNA mismatch repair protein MutS2
MLYPYNIEQKLGFDKIKNLLDEYCLSPMGRGFVAKMRFNERAEQVEKLLLQCYEMLQLKQAGVALASQSFFDCQQSLQALAIEGNFLNETQYHELKLALNAAANCMAAIQKHGSEKYPNLLEINNINTHPDITEPVSYQVLVGKIASVIDDRGKLRDNASPELQSIRKQTQRTETELRQKLDGLFKHARNSGWIGDDFSLAIRNGRMVIPLLAEHKRKIRGFVHDESDSGKTVFLEPTEVLELNNQLKEQEAAERREIIKILVELATYLRPAVPQMKRSQLYLGLVDFLNAKAQLASELQATLPQLIYKPTFKILGARHPLLYLSFKKADKNVVPLHFELPEAARILVVSGPNAGGKSVMLKTIGLLQYMLQCGLLVPVSEASQMGVFKNLFMDIGDEQSIENDLSTYSSHLRNMRYFTEHANADTLFLIDEFGTGTEPALGGAIAEAILEELLHSNAYGVINTHYSNLKFLANKATGLSNGAMRFDAEHLEPLFELEIGQPGSSFALEIAQKIGLKKKILHHAKQKLGNKQVNFEKLLKELEIEKKVYAERNLENATLQRKLAEQLKQYTELKEMLDNQKKAIINTAKADAKNLLRDANQKIELTIKQIKESAADKQQSSQARQQLKSFETEQLKPEKPAPSKPAERPQAEPGAITAGSLVRIKGQETIGEVLSLNQKEAEVAIGQLKSYIKLSRLEKISKKEYQKLLGPANTPESKSSINVNEKLLNFSFNADIRGQRAAEALQNIDNLMSDAIMLGYPELRIIHGKGDGILRTLIRQHLRSYKQIASLTDDHPDRGGAGVTIVVLH